MILRRWKPFYYFHPFLECSTACPIELKYFRPIMNLLVEWGKIRLPAMHARIASVVGSQGGDGR